MRGWWSAGSLDGHLLVVPIKAGIKAVAVVTVFGLLDAPLQVSPG